MTVRVVIDGKDLRWWTVITSSAADLQLVAAVHPGSGQEAWLRVIEIADGQRLRIGPGAEFDRLVVALQAGVPDLQVEPQQPPYASWRRTRRHTGTACALATSATQQPIQHSAPRSLEACEERHERTLRSTPGEWGPPPFGSPTSLQQ